MARRKLTLDEKIAIAEVAAWQAHGKAHRRAFVWLTYAKILLPIALGVGVPAGLIWLIVRTAGSLSVPGPPNSSPVSAGPWPWVLCGISAAATLALLAYRWANPYRGGKALIAAVFACILIFALAILWARAAY
jgi:hypothetical protein